MHICVLDDDDDNGGGGSRWEYGECSHEQEDKEDEDAHQEHESR
jgi:hypothetical protein